MRTLLTCTILGFHTVPRALQKYSTILCSLCAVWWPRRGFTEVIVYFDDFLIIGDPLEWCKLAYDTPLHLLVDLGFTISRHKLVPPNSACTLLGSAIGHYCLHNDIACHKTSQTVGHSSWISKKTARKQNQLQHLASKLSKACQVVYGGQQILNTVNSLSLLRKFKLDGKFCSDIMWGVHFLKVFKGTWLFQDLCKNLIVQPWQLH